jgi:hypothetical protein
MRYRRVIAPIAAPRNTRVGCKSADTPPKAHEPC